MLPLLAITAFIRRGKDSMRLYKVQAISNSMLFANDVLADQEFLVQDLCRHCLRVYSQRFSIGERSGEFGGQFSM